MPVNRLFCEGSNGSPDVRVLRSILRGVSNITIQPQGTKYGLGAQIQAYRAALPGVIVAGIRDSDFDRDHPLPAGQVREWYVENGEVWLGWYWERVEIENYLLDPSIARHALNPARLSEAAYQDALQEAVSGLMEYTAARAALSRSRGRFQPLRNNWGYTSGIRDHLLPDVRTEAACRQEIVQLVTDYGARVPVSEVLNRFDELLPEYRAGGRCHSMPLLYVSGKDLLCTMQPTLVSAGFANPGVFRERVLSLLERSTDDIWTWLPEWTALRSRMISVTTNTGAETAI